MKLFFNASRVPYQATGIFRYAKILGTALNELNFELTTLRSNKNLTLPGQTLELPSWLTKLKDHFFYPIYWYIYACAFKLPKNMPIISATQHLLPFRKDQVVSILDMRPYHAPDTILQWIYARFLFPRAIKNIRAVITISESSKQEIISLYNLKAEAIHVVYLYHDEVRRNAEPTKSDKPFLLMVGASFKHKNLHLALANHTSWSERYRLIVIATKNSYVERMMKYANELGISGSVDFRFSIDDHEKQNLFQNATALLYISNMEGFGIPPLEAMSYGTPCILSQIPVMQELYYDAGLFINPELSSEWNRFITQLGDPTLINDIVSKGYIRAREFNSERTREMLKCTLMNIFQPDHLE
jgi:glycosyltransferase involved in cell wall biosynthesis